MSYLWWYQRKVLWVVIANGYIVHCKKRRENFNIVIFRYSQETYILTTVDLKQLMWFQGLFIGEIYGIIYIVIFLKCPLNLCEAYINFTQLR